MNDTHNIDLDRAVQTELSGDPLHLIGGQHNAEPQQHVVGESQQSDKQQRCLQECGKTDGDDLTDPLHEAVSITPGNTEHVQRADADLDQQDTAALDILEKDFNHAVSEGDQAQQVQQAELNIQADKKTTFQDLCALTREIERLLSRHQRDQIV